MKKTVILLICIGLIFLFACSPSPTTMSVEKEKEKEQDLQTTAEQQIEETDEAEEIVRRFLIAYFTNRPDDVADCVPDALRSYFADGTRNAHWNAETVEISLTQSLEVTGEYSDELRLRRVEEEYSHETGVTFVIEEASAYAFEYHIVFPTGETIEDGGAFTMLAAKIDGVWYALPANL